jgi:hypothetical protein
MGFLRVLRPLGAQIAILSMVPARDPIGLCNVLDANLKNREQKR